MTDADPLIGASVDTPLGPLRVESRIGSGGFATVYAGRAGARDVALKVLLAEHIGGRAVDRFAREIAIVRQLRHPAIAELLDAGTLPDGRPYCAMERLRGRDLETTLRDRTLAPAEQIEIVSQLAAALGAAHRADIVHRDVKASNVFLCDDGRIVLLDFGIAKLAAASDLTRSREAIGTLGSMAPEQLTGQTVDARTDVYALGALVFQMATGRGAFRARDAATEIQLHRFAQRPRPSEFGAAAALDAVVAKAMAIRAADRYASTLELAGAVRAALGAAVRTRVRAVGIHVEAVRDLDALRASTRALAAHRFRPLTTGAAGGAWWCERARTDAGALDPLVREFVARGVAVAICVDELELDSGQAAGGPLADLWRWVPSAPPTEPLAPPDVCAMLA